MIGPMEAPSERLIYTEIRELTPQEVEQIMMRNDPEELRFVPISVSMFSNDLDSAQTTCSLLANHADANVRGNAVLSFGHLARRFGQLDLRVVEPIYRSALNDADDYVRSQAQDMLDDIRYYLRLSDDWPG
jgi:hypothetical protein